MIITTKNSNKEIEITPASFKKAAELRKAAFEALKNAGVLKDVQLTSAHNINPAQLIDKLIDVLLNADISDNFEKSLFGCLQSCTLQQDGITHKISAQLFDDIPELREDYYEIITACIEVNLSPFLRSLYTELSTRLKIVPDNDPESEQEQTTN